MVECRGASCGGELSRMVILGPPGGRVLLLSTEDCRVSLRWLCEPIMFQHICAPDAGKRGWGR